MRRALVVALAVLGVGCHRRAPTAAELGHRVFEDPALSQPAGQACADCHAPYLAFSDPETDHTTSMGVVGGHFGSRNAPAIMYARYVPTLTHDAVTGTWSGGLFWDGRGGALEQQAGFPLLNPMEMNNPTKATVVATVRASKYAAAFRQRYGEHALDEVDPGFAYVAAAIAAYERTPALAPFTSKYDRYLAHQEALSPAETRGLQLFEDPAKGNCASCHPSRPAADGTPPLFTNFGYANLGIPKYGNNQFYANEPALNPDGAAYIDHGLLTTTQDPSTDGQFRTPTLRNIARTGPYGHNGYFDSLLYLLDFLNTRDTGSTEPGVQPWAAPEVATTVDPRVGHLHLTRAEVDDLDAFLETLTDRLPKPPPPARIER